MEYTSIEQQTLAMMRRTDFKNLSKSDVLSIASNLVNCVLMSQKKL